MEKEKKQKKLTDVQREILGLLKDGEVMTKDRHGLIYIDLREVQMNTFVFLKDNKLIKTLRNKFVISEKGLVLLLEQKPIKHRTVKEFTLSPRPALEQQLNYAKSLGISIPKNTTSDELSYLISNEVDESASVSQIYCLNEQKIDLGKYVFPYPETVVKQIEQNIGNKEIRKIEIARWYIYSVERYLTKEKWETPDKSNITKQQSYEMAEKLIAGEDIQKSLMRVLNDLRYRYKILSFNYKDGYQEADTRTKVFKKAYSIVLEYFKNQDQYFCHLETETKIDTAPETETTIHVSTRFSQENKTSGLFGSLRALCKKIGLK